MFRPVFLILSGNAAAALLLLARNLLVARLIPLPDYGIAATFAIAMAVVEMMSALGLQQQIVQAKDGDDPRFQAALQGFQVVRGVLAGAILYLLAEPLAIFLNVPEVDWAYRVMALVPVLSAFTHFDIHRLNRSMVFWPMILTGMAPALLSVVSLWPLTMFYGDYRVMLYAILVQAIATPITSHLAARRPYRLALDRAVINKSLRFGWPLLMNGILLFAVFNGDKLIVGRELGMESLAVFAMGFTLTLTPTLVMAKSAQNFFLPQLSAADRSSPEGRKRFQHLAMTVMQASLLNGVILVTATVFLGTLVVHGLLGEKYQPLLPLFVPLAIQQAFRVAKAGAAVVALSCGRTGNAMQANLVRVLTLPLAWYALAQGSDLLAIILIATLGEFAGFALSLWLVRRNPGVALRPLLLPVFLVMLLFLFAAVPSVVAVIPWWASAIGVLSTLLAALISMKDMRCYASARRTDVPRDR